jgi:hypothetical protein
LHFVPHAMTSVAATIMATLQEVMSAKPIRSMLAH